MREAHKLISEAVEKYSPSKVYALFSGGDDSLVMTYIASQHPSFSGAVHINTGVGIEETREFVRETCKNYGWPLREIFAKEDCGQDYAELVIEHGFPGPAMHTTMYNCLKERPLRVLIRESKRFWRDKVGLVTGVRSQESRRRMGNVEPIQVEGVKLWIAPIHNWSKSDCLKYLQDNSIKRNPVSQILHMSGECLCGAFAHENELKEIKAWYPKTGEILEELQRKVKNAGCKRFLWGRRINGAPNGAIGKIRLSEAFARQLNLFIKPAEIMCSDCNSSTLP